MTAGAIALSPFLADVAEGLALPQKTLPPKYFYDDVGSALFEAITVLPEYGLTRADERLLKRHAGDVARCAGSTARVVELGSGSGRKTRWILEALGRPDYHPIDVSRAALERCRSELAGAARVFPHAGTYAEGLRAAAGGRGREPLLVLFLGSTIGNFEREEAAEFLRGLRRAMRAADRLLIGFDLVKGVDVLMDAYDDAAGVTAAFNRNLLARINRELGGDFDVRAFRHEARYDTRLERVEMHLRSLAGQTVWIAAAGAKFHFAEGETIWTESSHKYRAADLAALARQCGFEEEAQWVDGEWPFAESLWAAV